MAITTQHKAKQKKQKRTCEAKNNELKRNK